MDLSWLYGIWNPSIAAMVVYTLVMTHITIVCVTVYLHRHSAHRALDLHRGLAHFFRFWLWLTTGMRTKDWTAVHRKHHAACETPDDPHSPVIYGIKKVLLQGAELYREGCTEETLQRFGKGTPDDWMERSVYSRFPYLGVSLMMIINLVLMGPAGLVIWAVQMLWIPMLAAGVINGIGHYWGYRNFECPDAATNIVPWGILIGGEELHNNHHTYPNSAKLSVKPWEFDMGWFWIRLFTAVGLAKPLSTGPVVERIPGKHVVDMDTVWAVLNDRFKVMSQYADQVVKPLVEQESRRADAATRGMYRQAKRLLCRDERLVDAEDRARITRLIDVNPMLKTAYELRQQLQAVCAKRGGNAEELLNAFKQWCVDAEASGIQTLKDFAAELKSYSVPTLARA